MSMEKNYYVIAGYDLTNHKTDKYEDWQWTDEGEKYLCGLEGETVHLIDDPMCGEFLYLGYVLAHGDEYSFETTKFTVDDVYFAQANVEAKLRELSEIGVIDGYYGINSQFRIIVFEQCR